MPIPASFAPDSLWDYEGGIKGRLFDHLLEYQVDAYWIDWKNIQVQEVAPPSAHYTGNAGNAVAKGVEFEFTVRPIEHLRVDFSGSFQDAHLTTGATAAQLAIDPTLGRDGDKLADVAPFQYALGLNYTAPIAGDWTGTLATDITYRGKANTYFESNPFNIELNSLYSRQSSRPGFDRPVDGDAVRAQCGRRTRAGLSDQFGSRPARSPDGAATDRRCFVHADLLS